MARNITVATGEISLMVTSLTDPPTAVPRTRSAEKAELRIEQSEPRLTATRMHHVPGHAIAGCTIRLMAMIEPFGDTEADKPIGTVRFYDQYGLLGAAPIDRLTGMATLPHTFAAGGRREVWAQFSGIGQFRSSEAVASSLQVYGT